MSKENLREGTDHLANFLANGDDFYDIIHDPKAITTLVELEKAYSNHMQFTQKMHNQKIGVERDAIANAGFTEKLTKICKLCSQPALQEYANICTNKDLHGKEGNRKELIAFTGMRLQKKSSKGSTVTLPNSVPVHDFSSNAFEEAAAYERMRQHKEMTSIRHVEEESIKQKHDRAMQWRDTYVPSTDFF
jgi:hypothetical protein